MLRTALRSRSPLVVAAHAVLPEAERARLVEQLADRHWLASRHISVRLDATGLSCHPDPSRVPALGALAGRLSSDLGCDPEACVLRIRHYRRGEGHPPHGDHFAAGDHHLLATAILCLAAPSAGGRTRFPEAGLEVVPEANTLVVWANHLDDGREDPRTLHEGEAVARGDKLIALFLLHGPLAAAADVRMRILATAGEA